MKKKLLVFRNIIILLIGEFALHFFFSFFVAHAMVFTSNKNWSILYLYCSLLPAHTLGPYLKSTIGYLLLLPLLFMVLLFGTYWWWKNNNNWKSRCIEPPIGNFTNCNLQFTRNYLIGSFRLPTRILIEPNESSTQSWQIRVSRTSFQLGMSSSYSVCHICIFAADKRPGALIWLRHLNSVAFVSMQMMYVSLHAFHLAHRWQNVIFFQCNRAQLFAIAIDQPEKFHPIVTWRILIFFYCFRTTAISNDTILAGSAWCSSFRQSQRNYVWLCLPAQNYDYCNFANNSLVFSALFIHFKWTCELLPA